MKIVCLCFVAGLLAVQQLSAQVVLLTEGSGSVKISPPQGEGQALEVGHSYVLHADPDRGFRFQDWSRVNVFTLTTMEIDNGTVPPTTNWIVSTDFAPRSEYVTRPSFRMTVEPEQVLFAVVLTNADGSTVTNASLTLTDGWQADFVPAIKP